jgi:hypothetical protein
MERFACREQKYCDFTMASTELTTPPQIDLNQAVENENAIYLGELLLFQQL